MTDHHGGACTDPGVDADVFFEPAGREGDAAKAVREATAKRICGRCATSLREACLRGAIDRDERHGVFGGMTVDERDLQPGAHKGLPGPATPTRDLHTMLELYRGRDATRELAWTIRRLFVERVTDHAAAHGIPISHAAHAFGLQPERVKNWTILLRDAELRQAQAVAA